MSLRLEHLCKAFGGVNAVEDVSFEVPAGRITGLIGPNGAGKTTVVNLVTGMLAVTSGRILAGGIDITRAAPYEVARAGVARTFQNIRLFGEATVLENVVAGFHRHERAGFMQSVLGLPAARRERRAFVAEAEVLLDRLGLSACRDQLAIELSYGHQRKVEIARGLATRPSVLLLDEPVAGMHDAEAEEIGGLMRRLVQDGIGILLIEHNMRFVMDLCDEIHVVDAGRMVTSGPPEAVISNPEVIRAYLGAETC